MQIYNTKLPHVFAVKGYVFLSMVAIFFSVYACSPGAQHQSASKEYADGNDSISQEWLLEMLPEESPRLYLNPSTSAILKNKLAEDSLTAAFMQILRQEAREIIHSELLQKHIYDGRRMLAISREALRRMAILGMVYHIDKTPEVLDRINMEIRQVCAFDNWNPDHFLDVAEMAMGVAVGLDWTGGDLPADTRELAKTALLEKALLPGFEPGNSSWVNNTNNWNPVCHGGLLAAAIMVAHDHPEIAVNTINRALRNIPLAMAQYAPDGIYPEGVTYWGYGTAYTLLIIDLFEKAFGHDFGISNSPGFMDSPYFAMLMVAPSGEYFNFFDTQSNFRDNIRGLNEPHKARFNNHDVTVNMMWFASKTGNSLFFDPTYFLEKDTRRRSRFDPFGMIWLAEFEETLTTTLPVNWHGSGPNPIAVFTEDPQATSTNRGFYLGTKGGQASISHGHMDAGSFVFELDGVRWAVDPGIQAYAPLEQAGLKLWDRTQQSDRWTLLFAGTHGHSTLTVNNMQHNVDGYVPISEVRLNPSQIPSVTYDLTQLYVPNVNRASRTFSKPGSQSLRIDDIIAMNEQTETMTWQMMTTANVELKHKGALLSQNGKYLEIEFIMPEGAELSVISYDPPPKSLDLQVPGLKKIVCEAPAALFNQELAKISVVLRGLSSK